MARVTRRNFLRAAAAGGAAATLGGRALAAPADRPIGANDDVRVAMIGLGEVEGPGVGARGKQLIDALRKVPGVRIVALCDVDNRILGREVERFAGWQQRVKTYADLREVFDAQDVDAVFVATPNHWHALATIWACQAGKDVYVEKPASYNIWEGRQMVAAARKHNRIVQVGTQSRSSDGLQQAVEFLRSGELGGIRYAQAVIYRRRESIGKVAGPQKPPAEVDYNMWLGPAPEAPLMRTLLHYDWHWQWATGNGEIGNNGIHYLDRCRWLFGQKGLPRRAMSLGGRFAMDDDGETPNTHIALLDYEPAPIICELRGLPEKPDSKKMDKFRDLTMGIIVQCEGGYFVNNGAKNAVFDSNDRQIKEFAEKIGANEQVSAHQANFIEAMRSRKAGDLRAEILDGHHSAALCHLANISYRLGQQTPGAATQEATKAGPEWSDCYERFGEHLAANSVDLTKMPATFGPWVTIDPKTEEFVGEHAAEAGTLARRKDRAPFAVPEIA